MAVDIELCVEFEFHVPNQKTILYPKYLYFLGLTSNLATECQNKS